MYTDPTFTLFTRTGSILNQQNLDYSVVNIKPGSREKFSVRLILDSFSPTAAANPKPEDSKFIYYILIVLKFFFFDTNRHILLAYVVANLLGVFSPRELNPLPCVFLFHSHVPV